MDTCSFDEAKIVMVKVITGDIFESKAQTLVNTVNSVGVMGKGIALEFKRRFPEMYEDYVARCKRREVRLGEPYLFKRATLPWILNFPTKDDWPPWRSSRTSCAASNTSPHITTSGA